MEKLSDTTQEQLRVILKLVCVCVCEIVHTR
jgi:hypothetical protein